MKTFQLFALSCLLSAAAARADVVIQPTPNGKKIAFTANLQLSSCMESQGMSVCTSFGGWNDMQEVELAPVMNEPYHLRGYYSTVVENGGIRYIGIVTVDDYQVTESTTQPPINGPNPPGPMPPPPTLGDSYTFKVEILDNAGQVAQMSISVSSPDQLNNVVLAGVARKTGAGTMTAMFSIGPQRIWNCPNPPNPGGPFAPNCPVNPPTPRPGKVRLQDWHVEMGTLQ